MFAFITAMVMAGDPIPEIVVESHQNIEVYVAPTVVVNNTEIPYELDSTSVFGHTINDARNAKKLTQYGYVSMDGDIYVYNPDTIKFAWKDCDYSKKMSDSIISLPCHLNINQSDIDYICEVVTKYAK